MDYDFCDVCYCDYPCPCDAVEEQDDVCEHGLSAWLCAGPNHYPEGA